MDAVGARDFCVRKRFPKDQKLDDLITAISVYRNVWQLFGCKKVQ